MNETKAERGKLWDDDEVMALIEIWADEGIQQQIDSCTRERSSSSHIAQLHNLVKQHVDNLQHKNLP